MCSSGGRRGGLYLKSALPLLALVAACSASDPFDITVSTVDAIPTVIRVDWSTDAEGITPAWIEFGLDTDYGNTVSVDLSSGPPYSTLVLGSKPETEVHLRVVAETDDGPLVSGDQMITTGPSPAVLPNLDVTFSVEDHWNGYLLTELVTEPMVVILDSDGAYVWWCAVQDDETELSPASPMGPSTPLPPLPSTRASLSRDGNTILFESNNLEDSESNSGGELLHLRGDP